MKTPGEVVSDVASDYIKQLAFKLSVTPQRIYELLGKDNHYQKAWEKLLFPIGELNPDGLREIQADFNSRCNAILESADQKDVSNASFHRDLSHAVQMALDLTPEAEKKSAYRRAISSLTRKLGKLK